MDGKSLTQVSNTKKKKVVSQDTFANNWPSPSCRLQIYVLTDKIRLSAGSIKIVGGSPRHK